LKFIGSEIDEQTFSEALLEFPVAQKPTAWKVAAFLSYRKSRLLVIMKAILTMMNVRIEFIPTCVSHDSSHMVSL